MQHAGGCPRCGLVHEPDQLFVALGDELVVDTCQLARAYEAAHAEPLPPGSIAYHATHPGRLEEVLTNGLDPSRARLRCKHVALAETPGIAAGVLLPLVDGTRTLAEGYASPVVLEVDVSGLDLLFELGEARHHGARIGPSRLTVFDLPPDVDMTGWSDPAWRRDHSDCLALRGRPLDRRLLNAAEAELARRYPYDAFDDARFGRILDELTATSREFE
jgi:hypothetical protein